jgi:hypothetical protein
MLQNSVSISVCQNVANALNWVKTNMADNSILLVHRAFYGWALSTINPGHVLLYEYDNPLNSAELAAKEGYAQIYLIWWVNGQGWYGQPTVPSPFRQVYHSGTIAIYTYASI